MTKVIWRDEPAEHDYPAARSYLSLLASPADVELIIARYEKLPVESIKAKDVIRASGLKLLPKSNFHVHRDLEKIKDKKALSPILLVRGNGNLAQQLTIADGYHRACAVYWNSEDDFIHAKIADWKVE
jgi:hypothetical protein